MDEENYNEQEALTLRLLNAICEGVHVPTDEEQREAADIQEGI